MFEAPFVELPRDRKSVTVRLELISDGKSLVMTTTQLDQFLRHLADVRTLMLPTPAK